MQNDRAIAIFFVLLLTFALIASALWASVTFTPPDEKQVQMSVMNLTPQDGSRALGIVGLISNIPNTRFTLTMEVKGLNPGRIYTAWFAGRTSPSIPQTQGIGPAPSTLQTDSRGSAKLVASLNYNPKTRWKRIEVTEHRDKNPRNLKNIRRVLVGNMSELK